MFKILLAVCLIAVSVNGKPQLGAIKETLSSGIGAVTGVFDGCKGKDHALNADKSNFQWNLFVHTSRPRYEWSFLSAISCIWYQKHFFLLEPTSF